MDLQNAVCAVYPIIKTITCDLFAKVHQQAQCSSIRFDMLSFKFLWQSVISYCFCWSYDAIQNGRRYFEKSRSTSSAKYTHTKGINRSQAPPDFISNNDTVEVRVLWLSANNCFIFLRLATLKWWECFMIEGTKHICICPLMSSWNHIMSQ